MAKDFITDAGGCHVPLYFHIPLFLIDGRDGSQSFVALAEKDVSRPKFHTPVDGYPCLTTNEYAREGGDKTDKTDETGVLSVLSGGADDGLSLSTGKQPRSSGGFWTAAAERSPEVLRFHAMAFSSVGGP
jgi:hypothetical protein